MEPPQQHLQQEQAAYSNYEKAFPKGSIVEVSSDDEGMRGSWYTATVIRSISPKSHKILVEYHNLMADDAGSKPLREFVPAVLVRPIPPREPNTVFELMDDVDAYHNDGWWEGVVTNVIGDATTTKNVYSVFFRCSREQIDFGCSDLRLHREWVPFGSFWVPPFASSSPGQRKGSGECGINGFNSSGESDRVVMRNGGRRTSGTPTEQDGVMKNGRYQDERRGSNGAVNNYAMGTFRDDEKLRINSNGVCKKTKTGN